MFLHLQPPPPLSTYVRLLWYYEGYAPATTRERLLPTGTLEIVFDLDDAPPSPIYRDEDDAVGTCYRNSVICGPQSRYFVLDTSKPRTVVGIHFAPGGAARFLRVPMGELRDRHVALDSVWKAGTAASVRDELLEAPTAECKLRVLETALYRLAIRPFGDARHGAIDYALRQFTSVPHVESLARVSDRLSLSPRRFIQLFSDETGFTPKLYCRVMRFQAAIQRANTTGNAVNWSALASDCGYFDQAHFIHDFKAFTGLRPSTYASLRGHHLNHVPLAN